MYLFKRNGIYYVSYFDETQNREKRISTKQSKKTEAIKFVSELKERLLSRPKNDYILLSAFHNKYLQYVKDNLSVTYARNVDLAFRQLIEFAGDIPLESLDYLKLDKFTTESFKRTKEGARTTYIALKSALNKAISWNYITINHLTKIKLSKIPKNNPVFIKENEFNELIKLEPDNLLKDIYRFAFYTGLRLSEIIYLKWNEIDLTEGIIRVRNTADFTTKSKKERIIPINETVKEVLIKRFPKIISLGKDNYLFAKNGVRLNGDYITKKFKKCIKASTLNKQLHFHNLRHSFASNMAVKGVSIFIIRELLGHSDVKTTQIYSHLRPEDLRTAVNVLNN